MIIAINGSPGSGKDTVGRMIQYLGYGADKAGISYSDWDGKPVWGTFESSFFQRDWEIKKFAGKLKEVASILTGIPVEKFEDQEFKKSYLSDEWSYLPKDEIITDGIGLMFKRMTVRELLQWLGTDALRNHLHKNVWVNALMCNYVGSTIDLSTGQIDHYPDWIITDLRFPNEFDAVVAKHGITLKVVRPGVTGSTHESDTALNSQRFDYTIVNDGTIEDLLEKVKEFYTSIFYVTLND
jgi:hypothetical protein